MRLLRNLPFLIVLVFFIVLGAWFFQDNPEPIALVILGFKTITLPISIWLLAVLFVGCLLGIATSYPILFRLKAQTRLLKTQLSREKKKATGNTTVGKAKN